VNREIERLERALTAAILRRDGPTAHTIERELQMARRRAVPLPPVVLPLVTRALPEPVVKAVDIERRIVTGWASTSSPDYLDDIVEPRGAKYRTPLPVLWGHQRDKPIGTANEVKTSAKGIWIKATIAKFDKPGIMRDLTDMAWDCCRSGLARGFSIGFRPIDVEALPGGRGYRYKTFHLLETSLVVIGANSEAVVESVG
jgi:HK97 family phage prohead protease